MNENYTIRRIRRVLRKWPAEKLPQLTISGAYTCQAPYFSRSLLWKTVAFQVTGHCADLGLSRLKDYRKDYEILRSEFPVPWNELDEDHEFYQKLTIEGDLSDSFGKKMKISRIRVEHDPLSGPKKHKATDIQTLESLVADVNRLFPQKQEYFIESISNRQQLIEILFIWWKLNGGHYSQGLHELAGIIFIAVQTESINADKLVDPDPEAKQVATLMDSKYLTHDVFNIFNKLSSTLITLYYDETSLLQESIKFDLKLRLIDKYQYHLLKNKLRIDSSIWLIRYFRLLLIREIGLENSFELWDKLIAFSYTQNSDSMDLSLLLPYLIILLLSIIKSRLIISDYGEALFLLLHYPIDDKYKRQPISSAILVNDDLSSPTEELSFTYIEENHQAKHSNSFELEPDQSEDSDLVSLDISQLANDAIVLFQLSDQDLGAQGSKIIERYSGLSNEEDKQGTLTANPVKKRRPSAFRDLLTRSTSWNKSKGSQLKETKKPPAPKKDFDRTRLELRLASKVSQALKADKK
ncbi:hypothetical protein OGAPHI_004266 [Ogataea philodendri]|uniref:Rab-GAP TBC domain-containing protein n=1 Tax=Ogataea philodendri TaxID=1378263 RepID=A0A9P8P6C7_9ASCO|nr:uncharacterized protein OGAPHI_004266 [Ogataea philodendri]KAH3666077.1 hypothetical protein OGAPHI_004266 [Ogataea philodendri]